MKRLTMHRLLLISLAISSLQANDNRIYLGASFNTELFDKVELQVTPEWRSDPSNDIDQYHLDLSLSYEPIRRLKFAAGFRRGKVNAPEFSDTFDRHHFDARYTLKWERLSTQFRIRYTSGRNEEDNKRDYLRYRLKVGYDLKDLDFRPYLAYEFYDNQRRNEGRDRQTYGIGFSYELLEKHEFSTEFRWVDRADTNRDHTISEFTYGYIF